jgi:hypothetical protein
VRRVREKVLGHLVRGIYASNPGFEGKMLYGMTELLISSIYPCRTLNLGLDMKMQPILVSGRHIRL